jgi:hypothetical protein
MINEWWASDGRERYWLEITNRADLGANLLAPKVNDRGHEYWSYSLVAYAGQVTSSSIGTKDRGPAIVGYSLVAGTPRSSSIRWQSRGRQL